MPTIFERLSLPLPSSQTGSSAGSLSRLHISKVRLRSLSCNLFHCIIVLTLWHLSFVLLGCAICLSPFVSLLRKAIPLVNYEIYFGRALCAPATSCIEGSISNILNTPFTAAHLTPCTALFQSIFHNLPRFCTVK